MDWSPYYPAFVDNLATQDIKEGQPKPLKKQVTVADIGCGFGGLLVVLAPMLPDELILGLEIRTQVTEYVQDRISALRSQHTSPIENRKIVFPSWTVENDSYIPIPKHRLTKVEGKAEYIVNSIEGSDKLALETTETKMKNLLNAQNITPCEDSEGRHTRWVAHLTSSQATEISKLESVQKVEENVLDQDTLAKGITSGYYDSTSRQVTDEPLPTPYQNIFVLRANTMKFLPNFFHKAQLSHIFLCFPDPHFKARKHKQRIVSSTLCAEYAFVLRPGGCVYTITDVEELGNWMRERFAEFGGGQVFEKVEVPEEGKEREWIDDDDDGEGGPVSERGARREVGRMVRAIREETEEGKKVTRNGGKKFVGVWRRREDPAWPGE